MEEHAERALETNTMVFRQLQHVRAPAAHSEFRITQPRERGGRFELALQPAHFADFYGRLARPGEHVRLRLLSGAGALLAAIAVPTRSRSSSHRSSR